jgi:hypothetical protein
MGSDPIATAKTEDLLAELRDRLAKNGQVVKVVPFADKKIRRPRRRRPDDAQATRRRSSPKAAAPEDRDGRHRDRDGHVTEPACKDAATAAFEAQTETTADGAGGEDA